MHAADDDLVPKEVLTKCKARGYSFNDALIVEGVSTDFCGIHSLFESRCQATNVMGEQCRKLVVGLEDGNRSIYCPINGGAPCCQGILEGGAQCDYPVDVLYGMAGQFCSHYLPERTRCFAFTANDARCTIRAGLDEKGNPTKYCLRHLGRYQERRRFIDIHHTKKVEVGTAVSLDGNRKRQRPRDASRSRLDSLLTGRHTQSKRCVSGDDRLLAGDQTNSSNDRLHLRLARWLYNDVLEKNASDAFGFAKMLIHEMELYTAEATVRHLVPGAINMKVFVSSKKHKEILKNNLFLRRT